MRDPFAAEGNGMKIQDLLEHHGISRNPFTEEAAQTDPVFKDSCISGTHHPVWDKVFGDPREPATAIIFGEKGSGKTAMRLQIARHLEEFNRNNDVAQLFVVHYDDFNPFLDRFRQKLGRQGRRVERVLSQWKLWDHMDAILTLGLTGLVDRILDVSGPNQHTPDVVDRSAIARLNRHQSRDLLLLAACYDQSTAETVYGRWSRLRKTLKFRSFVAWRSVAIGVVGTTILVALLTTLAIYQQWGWLRPVWLYVLLMLAIWTPWLWRFVKCPWLARAVTRHVRIGNRETGTLRKILLYFADAELSAQPLPAHDRTDDRYELLSKFQGVLAGLGHSGVVVLVDRLDEPHLINGSVDLMKALLWPMLDNKFLKQSGIGLKMMLPIELVPYVDREEQAFFQRARLDKQNMVRSLEWTGEALYDVANARLRACASDGATPKLTDLFDESVSEQRLIDALRTLRVPRHLFKFLYRLLVAHSTSHTEGNPVWKIPRDTFESALAVYNRDQDAVDRGMSAG